MCFSTERINGESSSGGGRSGGRSGPATNSKECNDLILVSFLHLQWRNIVILVLQSGLQPARMSAGHWLLGNERGKNETLSKSKARSCSKGHSEHDSQTARAGNAYNRSERFQYRQC